MERIGSIMQDNLALEPGMRDGQMAISQRRSESTKALLGALLMLAEARQTTVSEAGLRVYLVELAGFDIRDVQAATRQLGREPKGEYETAFPQLGTILTRTRAAMAERLRPAKWIPCGACSAEGMVHVNRDRKPCASDAPDCWGMAVCQCKRAWQAARDALRGEAKAA